MLVFIWFCCVYFNFQETESLFPAHLDLQKISQLTYKGQQYNVLKPTVHYVRDHFVDFIQKRNNDVFPTKRVFMDKNGFRHYWEGMELEPETGNLRKNSNSTSKTNVESSKVTFTTKAKIQPRRKKKRIADKEAPTLYVPKILRGTTAKIRTTFFCPHFGVVTMMTNLENFEE
ncbi:unnamed protein product [Leptidea sinapis]|uniref:Uncharacterized protein n=1 Tax=Leptidea sinapis TaxID=189913 RepID=A0A5E4QG51_9NEOP|nr:unnamed protein product [Leptidea sinapis]